MSQSILATDSLSHLAAAPTANNLAFWSTRPSLESDSYLSRLMVLNAETGTCTAWTQRTGRPTTLVWRNDEELLYATGSAVWTVRGPGDVRKVVHLDGMTVFDLSVAPGTNDIFMAVQPRVAPEAPVVIKGLPIKQDGSGLFKSQTRIVSVNSSGTQALAFEGIAWRPRISPNGHALAYLRRSTDKALSLLDAELWVTAIDRWEDLETQVRIPVPRLTQEAVWSPDGRFLAVLAREGTIGTPDPMGLWVWDNQNRELHSINTAPAMWIGYGGTLLWANDQELVIGEELHGHVRLMSVDVRGGARVLIEAEGSYLNGVLAPRGIFAFYTDSSRMEEVVRVHDGSHTVTTSMNPAVFRAPQEFYVAGFQGDMVQAWFLPAKGGEAKGTVLSIHGGPHGAFARDVSPLHSRISDAGFNVIYANPHGSVGYGLEFARVLKGHWGEVDEQDWAAIVKYCEDKGWLDRGNLAVLGSSYGGFMATWLAGHWPFLKAAVIQAPVADQIGMYWSSDIGYTFTAEGVGVDFSTDGESATLGLWNYSPLKWAEHVNAAVLLLHGSDDDRCPVGQSEALFSALKRYDKEAELIIYPGESHLMTTIGRPSTRIDRMNRIVDWLLQHMA